MQKHIVAVCDKEEKYALGLSSSLSEILPEQYDVFTFTGAQALIDYSLGHKIEVIIVSESTYDSRFDNTGALQTMILQETPDCVQEGVILIDRFQDREELGKSVLANLPECVESTLSRRAGGHRWKIIGIYSPVRRCLQTSFALSMGQMLGKDHKVLYMNFENFSGMSGWFDTEFKYDILDLLYFFDCDPQRLANRIPLMVHKLGDLDILPPAQSYYDTYDRSGVKWVEALQGIENASDYEYLILDLTDAVQGLLQLMSYCDRIYTLVLDDRISRCKLDNYERWMVDHGKADIWGKTMKFKLPQFTDVPDDPLLLTKCELAAYVKTIIEEDVTVQDTHEARD